MLLLHRSRSFKVTDVGTKIVGYPRLHKHSAVTNLITHYKTTNATNYARHAEIKFSGRLGGFACVLIKLCKPLHLGIRTPALEETGRQAAYCKHKAPGFSNRLTPAVTIANSNSCSRSLMHTIQSIIMPNCHLTTSESITRR